MNFLNKIFFQSFALKTLLYAILFIIILLPGSDISAVVREGLSPSGKDLYTGEIPFEKQGMACLACHHFSGVSKIRGGTLGPDLAQSFKDLDEEEITAILESLSSFPTMKPIYENRPLTSEEQALLKAFFLKPPTKISSPITLEFEIFAFGGLLLLLLVTHFLWRKRLRPFRESMGGKEWEKGDI